MAEAEKSTVARPYARAAFSHALDVADGLNKWSRMLAMLRSAIEQPVIRQALDNPNLSVEEEKRLLVDLMGGDLSEDGANFVDILAQYGRLMLLPDVSEQFELLKANHEKTMEVQVTSAFEVSDAEKNNLAAALARKLQREVNIETVVDESLIGGVIIKTEDTVIDDSVRGRLGKLTQALN